MEEQFADCQRQLQNGRRLSSVIHRCLVWVCLFSLNSCHQQVRFWGESTGPAAPVQGGPRLGFQHSPCDSLKFQTYNVSLPFRLLFFEN